MGVLKSGAGYVPIDPNFPVARKKYIAENSKLAAMLCDSAGMTETANYYTDNLLVLDLQWDEVVACPGSNPTPAHTPDSLVYVMYTSGSTGKPKGVAVENKSVVRLVKSTNYTSPVASTKILQLSNYAFDGSVYDIYGALLNGATLYLVEKSMVLSVKELGRYIESEGINTTFITTALFNSLVDIYPDCIASFDRIYFGGESASLAHVREALKYAKDPSVLVHVYGPTENTTFSTFHSLKDFHAGDHVLPIGLPISNTKVYVLGPDGQFVPPGVDGELYLGGDGLARGYWGEGAAAEKFVNGQGLLAGERLYKTGDLVRWTTQGTLEFRGRIDNQVKIRGNRIELSEIENAITAIKEIEKSFVTVKNFESDDNRIVAYYIPKEKVSKDTLTHLLRSELPDYMIPSYWVAVNKLPLNSNGKVDLKALPDPTHESKENVQGKAEPQTMLEKKLMRIWESVLKTDSIGVHDNFFMIGGDSLKAIRIVNQIQEELGEIIHVAALFETPTLAELAANIEKYSNIKTQAIDKQKLQDFRALVKNTPMQKVPSAKNKPAVFILSAPRSGSTLLRAVLGGHPKLFSPPELELLNFENLSDRKKEFSGKFKFYREGVIKALMEINHCSADAAEELMQTYEARNLSNQQMYDILQEGIGDRLLVDKSPFYTLDIDVLQRAESIFDGAKFIFLVRNPYGSVLSFEEAKIDQIFRREHAYNVRELAELIWTVSNENIRQFLSGIPQERKHFVTYETLVSEPASAAKGICEFLGLEYHEHLIDVYKNRRGRMMDGVYEESKTLGDIKILSHQKIDAEFADRWKSKIEVPCLSKTTIDLATELGYTIDNAQENSIPALAPGHHFPISHAQRRLWILSQIEEASLAYNAPQSWILEGELDIPSFCEAYLKIIHRHEVLRTVFELVEDEPRQKILPAGDPVFNIDVIDLRKDTNAYQRAEDMSRQESLMAFSLEKGPLIRSKIVRVKENVNIWILNMHHIVCDAWSISNISREMLTYYNGLRLGIAVELAPLRIQYKDFAAWQNAYLESPAAEVHKTFWHQQLGRDLPVMNFPTSYPRTGKRNYGGKYLSFDLPMAVASEIRNVANRNHCSLYITMLSVIKVLIYKYSAQDDIVIGTSVAGREHKELEAQVGLYLNTLVMRTKISSQDTFAETLAKVKTSVEGAYKHQAYPFNKIVDELQVDRDPSRNPIIDIMVDMQSARDNAGEMEGIKISNYYKDAYYNKFDLVFNVLDTQDGISLGIGFNTGLFSEDFIREIAASALELTQSLLSDNTRVIAEHNILSTKKKNEIIETTAAETRSYPSAAVLSLFNEIVEKHGHRRAVVSEELSYTYSELDAISGRLCR
ncbi:MAG: amino acid adenylation domain-containing protein, partial [Bacteroidota bacterium]